MTALKFAIGPLPSRVLMATDTISGVWTYSIELARALESVGIRVALATMGAPVDPEQREEAKAIPGLALYEGPFKLEWMRDPWDDVARAGRWLLEIADAVRPELVHLNGFAHGSLPWGVPCVVVGHRCVVSWWRAVRGESPPPVWERYREAVALGLGGADLVVAPTRAMLDALEEHYGPPPRARVIPHGCAPRLRATEFKQQFVIAAGRPWDEADNVATLARAAERLEWPVCVAGDTHGPDGASAPEAGVRYLGRLGSSELADWFGRAAVFARPSLYEPFGLEALEAALAGCALVLGDLASQREVWGDAALLVPPGDAAALAAALRILISDPERRHQMADRARRRALEYTADRMMLGYVDAYADAAAEQFRRRSSSSEEEARSRDPS